MSRPLTRRDWLLGAAACGLGAAGVLGCERGRDRLRVYLQVAETPGLPTEGLRILVTDHLEALGGYTVLPWPPATSPLPARSRATLLSLQPRFDAGRLGFEVETSYPSGLRRPRASVPPAPPLEAFARLVGLLPLKLDPVAGEALCPSNAAALPGLLATLTVEDDPRRGPEHLAAARTLARSHPGCASAQFLLANQLYNQLLLHPLEQEAQWSAFQAYRAGLASVPGHPRGVGGFSQLLADSGLHRDALAMLEEVLGRRPAVPRLHRALAYVARTAGLLDLARKALGEVNRLTEGPSGSHCENTYLYLGDLEAYRATCRLEGTGRDARVHFYLGYLALMAGDRQAALPAFRASTTVSGGWYGFEELAALYVDALEVRPEAAAARLRALAQQRSALRAPDGEFTFKLAEAASFLGDLDRAAELGELAFTQGFGCTRWFEHSPFLAAYRATDRWAVLRQHLKDREALLAARYPPRRFNL
jgi:hypothetical protein